MAKDELLAAEKEALGMYVSATRCRTAGSSCAALSAAAWGRSASATTASSSRSAGWSGIKAITTRRGEAMVFVRLDDLEGSAEIIVQSGLYTECRELLREDGLVLITGQVDQKSEGETKLVARAIVPFVPDPDLEEDRLLVRIDATRFAASHMDELKRLLSDHSGSAPVIVEMRTTEGDVRLRFGEEYRVDSANSNLVASLMTMFGPNCVAV